MVPSLLSVYLRRPHAATSNEPWAVLAFADFPLAPSPRCHIRDLRSDPWHCQTSRMVRVGQTSRVARVGSGRACDWLQVYQPLQRRAAEDVRRVGGSHLLEDLTPRRHPLCSAVLRPCCAVCNSLAAFQSAQAVVCARADAAHIRARRASGCGSGIFETPCPGLCGPWAFAAGPHLDPHLGPHLGPRSGVPGVPQPAALAALHHRVPQGWCWPWLVQALHSPYRGLHSPEGRNADTLKSRSFGKVRSPTANHVGDRPAAGSSFAVDMRSVGDGAFGAPPKCSKCAAAESWALVGSHPRGNKLTIDSAPAEPTATIRSRQRKVGTCAGQGWGVLKAAIIHASPTSTPC